MLDSLTTTFQFSMHIHLSLWLQAYHLRKSEVDLRKKKIPSKFLQVSIYKLTKTPKPKHFPFQILFGFSINTLLEIWHFATVLCNWFSVACDTCNWKFAQLPKTSYVKFAVACDSRIIQVHTVGLYSFIHPYSILAVGRATACNYRGCVHIALHVN